MSDPIQQKVAIHFASDDILSQKKAIAQINNVLNALKGVAIELVVHSDGITLLSKNNHFKSHLEDLNTKGVVILACNNTLKAKNIDPAALPDFVKVVPSALAHLIVRQSEGWSYIKAS